MYRKSVGECTCTREQSPPPVGDGVILNEAALSGEGKDLARRPATLHARSSPRLNRAGLQDEACERCP
jgi:hypothetical protein